MGPFQPEYTVQFEVRFKKDIFPGFGYDPVDIVKALKKDIEGGSVQSYVINALAMKLSEPIYTDEEGADPSTSDES